MGVGIGMAVTFTAIALASTVDYYVKLSQSQKSVENIVLIEYTYECEKCGDELAEGYFSFVDNLGYEECKSCNDYKEIKESRVDVKK